MRIGVTTPTGTVGRLLLRSLVRAGHRPVALVRDPDRLDPAVRPFVDAVVIDQLDPRRTTAATAGLDALYWVDPTTPEEDPLVSYGKATDAVAAAVQANRIPRVVFQSSIGAELRQGAGEIDGLAATEVALDATGADVAHLRCGSFFTNLTFDLDAVRSGMLETVLPLDLPFPWASPADVAEVAAGRLAGDWSGRVVQGVLGPADLSWADAVQVVAAATGRPLAVTRIEDEEQRAALRAIGMTDARVESVLGMSTFLRGRYRLEPPRDVVSSTPITLASWAHSELRPLL